jgi:hypothetical protein
MKRAALTVAVGLAWVVLATPSGLAGQSCPKRPESRQPALLTIKALHMVNQPIRTRVCDLAFGPIWDGGYTARPGQGLTMVIDAHDVTPVPGYGRHGPFYRLYLIKPGYVAKIRWNGVWRTYRFVMSPTPHPQRPKSEVDKPIKAFRGEVVYFRCCWPRYTTKDYLYERAVLVKPQV